MAPSTGRVATGKRKLPRGTTREVEDKRERERPNGGAPPTRKRSTDVRTEGRRSRDETKETDLHSGWLDGSVDGKLVSLLGLAYDRL